MLIRVDKDSNYKAVFFNGKTVRMPLDRSKKILVPKYAEIEDVSINSKCLAMCKYCYTSATKNGKNFEDIVGKAKKVWGERSLNDRPFQIAIGGAGESTMHPDWIEFVKTVKELGIMPNYTTNGMHLSDEIVDATIKYCGGVAVSFHPHIENIFHAAIKRLSHLPNNNVKLNCHVIVGSENSLNDLKRLFGLYKDVIDYFVILPYQAAGRGTKIDAEKEWKETFDWISSLTKEEQKSFAFGALFYNFLKSNNIPLTMSLYEPEIYSGYRMLDDSFSILRKSSYDLSEKK